MLEQDMAATEMLVKLGQFPKLDMLVAEIN